MIDTCFATHHLLFAEDANNTLWTSSGGGGGVVGWLNTKMWDETHDAPNRKAGRRWFSTPMATASAMLMWRSSRTSTAPSGESLGTSSAVNVKGDPKKDTRLNACVLRPRHRRRWHDLGQRARLPRRHRAPESRLQSARDSACRILRGPWNNPKAHGLGLLAARDGYRSQQRRMGGAWQRPPGQLRSQEVQGSSERPEGHRASIAPKAGHSIRVPDRTSKT